MAISNESYEYLRPKDIEILVEHRYPWKISEIIGLAGFAAIGLLLVFNVQPAFLGAVVLAVLPYMVYLNISRKAASRLIMAQTPAGLKIYKGKVAISNPNGFEFSDVSKIVHTKDLEGNEFIVLQREQTPGSSESASSFKVPSRLYDTVGGKGLLSGVASSSESINISDAASKIIFNGARSHN